MNLVLRRLRGVIGMGVTWAIAWAVIGGTIMEGIVDPRGEILDMWPQTLAVPGFLCGISFSVILWFTQRRRRFDELSLLRFSAWGAGVGLLLTGLALGSGLASSLLPLWWRIVIIGGPVTVLSAISATGTLMLARRAERRALSQPLEEVGRIES